MMQSAGEWEWMKYMHVHWAVWTNRDEGTKAMKITYIMECGGRERKRGGETREEDKQGGRGVYLGEEEDQKK